MGTLTPISIWRTGRRPEQGGLERKRAADQETDEIVPPEPADVRLFVGQLAVSPDAILRQVGPQVGQPRGVGRNGIPRLGHIEQRARLRIAAAKLMEVVRPVERQDDQVRLGETGGQPGGLPGETAVAAGLADAAPRGKCLRSSIPLLYTRAEWRVGGGIRLPIELRSGAGRGKDAVRSERQREHSQCQFYGKGQGVGSGRGDFSVVVSLFLRRRKTRKIGDVVQKLFRNCGMDTWVNETDA